MSIRSISLGVLILAAVPSSILLAQNGLRPNTLPPTDAKPIRAPKQSSGGTAKEARLLLHEALQISRSAKKIEQFTEIIELCKRAGEKPLEAEEAKYARDLMSWSYNKRGEAYAAQAAEFMSQQADQDAAKLDRQALEDFKASVELDPNRWKAIHNRGVSYGVLGLHDDAIADFTRVVKLKPDYVNAWFNRAEIQLENGRFAEAIRDYTEAIQLKPQDGTVHRQRGRAYVHGGESRLALADFDRAVQLNRDDVISLVERGETYARLGDWEAAASDFQSALDVDPDSAEGYRGAAWLMATCPQVKYRNSKAAIEAAEQAIDLASAQEKLDFTYHDTLAAAYANASRFAEAQQMLQKAIQKAPLADAAVMKKRLGLYLNQRPYREEAVATAQPASLKVRPR